MTAPVSPSQPTNPALRQHTPRMEWRCFHCGDLFCDEADARDHFGPDTEWQPGCIDPLTKDEKGRRHDQVAMYQELDRERDENSRLANRDYVLSCFERDLAKMFDGAKSVTQAYLVLDSMEGRALAAEEQVASLKAANDVLHENNVLALWQIEEMQAALRNIIAIDRKESFRTIECDPAGNTMEITEIDGPCALLARGALQSSTPAVSR